MRAWPVATKLATAASGKTRGRGLLFAAALAALAALVAGVAPAAAQFSAQPVIMELRPDGEDTSQAMFWVRNESDEPLQLRVYAADYEQSESGSQEFMPAGTHPRSCADRLQFYPDNLALPARGVGEVRVLMRPGAETCWSLVFVQSVSRSATGIQIAQRIGIRIYGVTNDAVPEGEIRSVEAALDENGQRVAAVTFVNTGDGPARPEGELEIRSETGALVGVVPIPPFSVLPGRTSTTTMVLDLPLEPGTYLLIPILDFGGDYLAGGQGTLAVH